MSELGFQKSGTNYLQASLQMRLFRIAGQMQKSGLPDEFIATATRLALEYEGIADLFELWADETEQEERDEIIADIHELLNDCNQPNKEEMPYIKFTDLGSVAKDIRAFKDSLLQIVEESGGIKTLAERTDMPQPSLSRFFNSNSMPHRATLLKIAKALNIDGVRIATYWQK